MIVARDLVKSFGNFRAVDGISLEVEEGETFGLLGPNGAGKTTLISMLSTSIPPDSGSLTVLGYDATREAREIRKSIGVVFQDPTLDDRLTGRENLEISASLYGVAKGEREKNIEEALKLVELQEWGDVFVRAYSRGMKRRLEIARALIHGPKLLFLDEPTLGLDPKGREEVWRHFEELEVTTVIATNYMEEAERLCDRVAMLNGGRVVALDTPKGLKAVLKGDVLVLKVRQTPELMGRLREEFQEVKALKEKIVLTVKHGEEAIPSIMRIAGEGLKSIEIRSPTLNDVFLHYTGREIEEGEAQGRGVR